MANSSLTANLSTSSEVQHSSHSNISQNRDFDNANGADYQFPLLSPEHIANFLQDFGVQITESSIRKPDALSLKKIYSLLMELMVGTPPDQNPQPMLYGGIQNEYPEIHEEVNALMFRYHDLNRVMVACGINNFEPWDIIEPSSKRLISILSGAINCYFFKETRLDVFQALRKENEHFREQHDHLLKANQDLRKRAEQGHQILKDQEPRNSEVRAKIEAHTKLIEELHRQLTAKQKCVNEVKRQINEKTSERDQLKVQGLGLQRDREELSAKIVQSPERVKVDQERQMAKVAELKAMHSEKVMRLTQLRQRGQWLQRVEDQPDQTLKLLHSIQQTLTQENEEVKQTTGLQDKVGELGRQLGEMQRQQEQMRQRKQVRQEKVNKHRVQHQAKLAAIKSQVEELRSHMEDCCKPGTEKGEIMRQKVKLQDEERKAEQEHVQLMDRAHTQYSELIQKVDEGRTGFAQAWEDLRREFMPE